MRQVGSDLPHRAGQRAMARPPLPSYTFNLRDRIEPPTEALRLRQTPGIWPLEKHDKGEYIFLTPGHALNLPPAPPLDESSNPYRGLQSFERAQSDLFFGRQALTAQLSKIVRQQPLTIVLGASGSGKSSLVKAGLIPLLSPMNQQPAPNAWHVLAPMRPGESPFQELSKVLAGKTASGDSMWLNAELAEAMLTEYLAGWIGRNASRKLLLIIDQFEELITLCQDEVARDRFIAGLKNAIAAYPDRLRLVLTLRSDFEPQFQDLLPDADRSRIRFVVPPMARAELREAIEAPASKRVMYFQSDDPNRPLVEQLIDEVVEMPGALPLLSFTLSELYLMYLRRQQNARDRAGSIDRAIVEADYKALGGVAQSLTQRADQEYEALIQQDRAYAQTIRHVLLRMVAVGSTELARRRVPLSELDYPPAQNARVKAVIRQFSAARLLVEGIDSTGRPYVEPAHDALVRGWQRLLAWKQAEESRLILQRRLAPAATEWNSVRRETQQPARSSAKSAIDWVDRRLFAIENLFNQMVNQTPAWRGSIQQPQRSPEKLQESAHRTSSEEISNRAVESSQSPKQFLWNANPYLEVLHSELKADDGWFNQVETEFVRESLLQKRQNRSWRGRLAIAIIAGLSGLTLTALIGQRANLIGEVSRSVEAADANFLAGQQLDAFLNSLQAARPFQNPLLKVFQPNPQLAEQVRGTLQRAVYSAQERNRLEKHQGIARSRTSPDGQTIVSAGEDGVVSLWSWRGDRKAQWDTRQRQIEAISFSPNGQSFAIAGRDGTVRLWNLQGQQLASFQGHTGAVRGLSFSPDGQRLATGGEDKTIRLWNLQGESLAIFSGHQAGVSKVAFSPDGQRLASASADGTFRLWNLQARLLQQVEAQQGYLSTISFSPDGQRLATAGQDGRIRLWTLQGQPLAVLQGHQGQVWDVTFSPDGRRLASVAGDGTIRLWTSTGKPLTVLSGHQGPVRNISFGPDGQRLTSSGDDGTVRLWDLQGQQQATLSGHRGPARAVAFSANGQTLATGGEDATVRLWTALAQPLDSFEVGTGPIRAIAFHPNHQQLASAQGNAVRLWNLQGQPLAELTGHSGLVRGLQFSPDGQRLVSAGDDGSIRLWDSQGQFLSAWRADEVRIWTVQFSPDGQQIVSGGNDGIVRLWDLQGKLLQSFEGHLGPVYSVGFSPNGKQLASSGQDATVRLWTVEDDRERVVFQVYDVEVNSVAFSPDGEFLVSGDGYGNVQMWDLLSLRQFATWSAHPNSIIRQVGFSPDGRSIVTAADDGTAKLWPVDSFDRLFSKGCSELSDYLRRNPDVAERDRRLCASRLTRADF